MPSARKLAACLSILTLAAAGGACSPMGSAGSASPASSGSDGPSNPSMIPQRLDGNVAAGREVFRFETFGNERFWTDAVRLPAGMVAARVTPMQALDLGVQIDMDALPAAMRDALAAQLRQDPSGRTSALLNDPAVTIAAINANAVIGMPIKDSNGDGLLDAMRGDKVGASCALCHTMTDGAAFKSPNGGSIGHRVDGLANHSLNMGKILATAANSRALYPVLQLSLRANKGKTLGRAPTGLTENSSEVEVDAYLSNPEYYPVGMFDDSFDGNGDPMHNTPLFRQDLAAPYGSEGSIAKLENFGNLVYTSLFDQTVLTTPGGRAFLHKLGGAAGDEIADNYVKVLAATGVTGYPYVRARHYERPGTEEAPVGLRVDDQSLFNMNAYLASLQAPRGMKGDARMMVEGRQLFRTSGCTSCHNVDQSKPVPAQMVPMSRIFPGDNPMILAQRMPPLNPIMDTPGNTFDDKMAVVNASVRGDIRGIALPLLLDLARKPVFLHDNSVPSLEMLFDPSRGPTAPHPFYLAGASQRASMAAFLRSLDTGSR
jgi:cytochrome c2